MNLENDVSSSLSLDRYVPDRIKEGYGPNNEAMKSLAEDHDIIVCVDCGTLSFEPISIAKTEKCKVIVVDHHLASNELPIADAIINPKLAGIENKSESSNDLF